MRVSDFDFELPENLIALRPARPRDAARLLVIGPEENALEDRIVRDLPSFLAPGDLLVFNDTKVIPARLFGTRTRGEASAKIEVMLHRRVSASEWRAFLRPAKKLNIGEEISFPGGLSATVEEKAEGGEAGLRFSASGPALDAAIAAAGEMPLPPYIARKRATDKEDLADYQTLYAAEPGAVAAPTAGLHFTPELMDALAARGVGTVRLTLHVGAGTFLPVTAEDTEEHRMHAEWGEISEEEAAAINEARAKGGRIVAVGTTSLRLLESAADAKGVVHPFAKETDIFITPGYRFRATDILMTNFHLPRSTLFMLVSALRSTDEMKRAYAHAVAAKYRFYSYGDACLIYGAPMNGTKT
ncbi:MAG: tRNA preQ1(34) S-adenosylmethionine ribosyltransferase-isomerase QueA [Parvibaculum sp.]|jgi:S-adenosylmethionine:tRNA ribosyltransferase-isomerase|uniref:tRNA preQ1(34) S-adenosylmethionine ribosyltransferase-isomerase QueA n=1 Tax=Parvibaculum sp. TaxID=2024848 RepID=UPI000C55BB8F|nr:tRNA preQ1(34) S-adenosylmethionine ribosyltransferase-isomerase QueA [Parvibaculum sp.]MAU60360.1 tRNA preQ1(34) S-adenosylmethionine ribosyltransferase-isomerase QueA [Parvibaculum sp.]|tara:strand:+ start:14176 stop:15246 length:1071 start_codon:yes stop_codon:yes gene_type:complete